MKYEQVQRKALKRAGLKQAEDVKHLAVVKAEEIKLLLGHYRRLEKDHESLQDYTIEILNFIKRISAMGKIRMPDSMMGKLNKLNAQKSIRAVRNA